MLATFLIRHASGKEGSSHGAESEGGSESHLLVRAASTIVSETMKLVGRNEEVGRQGGGPGIALKNWLIETWLYQILMSVAIGIIVGFAAQYALRFALRR